MRQATKFFFTCLKSADMRIFRGAWRASRGEEEDCLFNKFTMADLQRELTKIVLHIPMLVLDQVVTSYDSTCKVLYTRQTTLSPRLFSRWGGSGLQLIVVWARLHSTS